MFDWIEKFADWIVFDILSLIHKTHLAEAIHFFIFDSIKIIILLSVVIFLMGIVNSYFPVEKVRNFLSVNKLFGFEYMMASLFGVVTPFCSCSSVPLFIGFVKSGIPLGVTLSFLVTSPLVNEVAIGLFVGLFGIKLTLIYVITGIFLGTASGMILQKMKLEKHLTPWVKKILEKSKSEQKKFVVENQDFKQRIAVIYKEVITILKGIVPYVIAGIAIGGLMHGYIPDGFFEKYMNKNNLFAVPLATVFAIPMYSNASGVLPVVQVLVTKGVPIGTAIAFMMGIVGLSLPEAILLKKVMTVRLIAVFFGVVAFCIILSGYFFNLVL